MEYAIILSCFALSLKIIKEIRKRQNHTHRKLQNHEKN